MPKLLFARPAQDAPEERQVRKLASSRHAPADWIRRATMIVLQLAGLTHHRYCRSAPLPSPNRPRAPQRLQQPRP